MPRTDSYSQQNLIIWPVWLSVRLQTKWLWVRIPLLSHKFFFVSVVRQTSLRVGITVTPRYHKNITKP